MATGLALDYSSLGFRCAETYVRPYALTYYIQVTYSVHAYLNTQNIQNVVGSAAQAPTSQ